MTEPRRIGEILDPALARLGTSDQARAYVAWARASGDQIASGARPRSFRRGVLTVECSSSVWANELTFLSDRLLRRMREVVPDHPVRRLRFMVGAARTRREDHSSPEPKEASGRRTPPADLEAARATAEGVRDERLRAAIMSVLGVQEGGSRSPSDDCPC